MLFLTSCACLACEFLIGSGFRCVISGIILFLSIVCSIYCGTLFIPMFHNAISFVLLSVIMGKLLAVIIVAFSLVMFVRFVLFLVDIGTVFFAVFLSGVGLVY